VKGQFNNNAFNPSEIATFNEVAKLEQTKVINRQFSDAGFITNKYCL
jgi:hypothetical protein